MVGKGIGLLVILAIAVGITPAFALIELERISINDPQLVNAFGNSIGNNVNADTQIQIASDITNNQEISQDFYYLVQVIDQNGFVVKVSWFSGNLNPHQEWNTSVFWSPQESGEYVAEIFVWDGFPFINKALSEHTSLQIKVS